MSLQLLVFTSACAAVNIVIVNMLNIILRKTNYLKQFYTINCVNQFFMMYVCHEPVRIILQRLLYMIYILTNSIKSYIISKD